MQERFDKFDDFLWNIMKILNEFIKKYFYHYQIERTQSRDDDDMNSDYNDNGLN